jgi:hypothetical protein
MRVAVNRRALEINRRITHRALHHPPIIIKQNDGTIGYAYDFPLPRNSCWKIVYNPDEPWIEVLDDGEPISFNVWIEEID